MKYCCIYNNYTPHRMVQSYFTDHYLQKLFTQERFILAAISIGIGNILYHFFLLFRAYLLFYKVFEQYFLMTLKQTSGFTQYFATKKCSLISQRIFVLQAIKFT